MKNKFKALPLCIIIGAISLKLILVSCTKDKVPPVVKTEENKDCPKTISFANDIMPIINDKCIGCHSEGSGSGEYNNYATISSGAQAILNSLQPSAPNRMPLGGDPLPDSTIQKISCWISQGKKDN